MKAAESFNAAHTPGELFATPKREKIVVFPRMTSTTRAVACPPYRCLPPSSCHQHQVLPRRIVPLPDRLIDLLSQPASQLHNLHSGVPAWKCIQR